MKPNHCSQTILVAVILLFFFCGVSHAASNSDAIISIQKLISDVEQMNLEEGFTNSLLSKLKGALDSLTANNAARRQDAIKKLNAFTNEVNAQYGKKMTPDQCNVLLPEAAHAIEFCSYPVIISLSKCAGSPGDLIFLSGYNFGRTQGTSTVSFGSAQASVIDSWSDTSIKVTVPSGASSGPITVTVSSKPSNAIVFFVAQPDVTFNESLPRVYPAAGIDVDYQPDPDIGIRTSISRLLLCFFDDVSIERAAEILETCGFQVIGTLPGSDLILVELANPTNLSTLVDIAKYLRGLPELEIVVKDVELESTALPPEPDPASAVAGWTWESIPGGGNWGQEFAHFPGAWNVIDHIKNGGESEIQTAVIDVGFWLEHPELTNSHKAGPWWQPLLPLLLWDHGNMVLGVLGARFDDEYGINGVNPFLKMHVIQQCTLALLPSQIDWLLENVEDLRVINLSFGHNWADEEKYIAFGGPIENPNTNEKVHEEVREEGKAFAKIASRAEDQNVIIVVAAGNDSDKHGWGWVDAKWESPMCYAAATGSDNILVVGALTHEQDETGNFKVRPAKFSAVGEAVDVMAPGAYITSTSISNQFYGMYNTHHGTSFAAPIVAGLVGYMYAFKPDISMQEVIEYIKGISNKGESNWKIEDFIEGADLNGDGILEAYTFPIIDAFQTMMQVPGFKEAVADVNSDGTVNNVDLTIVQGNVGNVSAAYSRSDINGDAVVDDEDLEIIESLLPQPFAAIAIAAGGYHSVALKEDGTVWAWGWNGYGQLGNGTTNDSSLPVRVSALADIASIAARHYHTLAFKSDGTVWAWGWNGYGQLGNGTTSDSRIPVQVIDPHDSTGFLTGVTAITTGDYHSIALKRDGTVWAWGGCYGGELGNGTLSQSSVPVQVSNLSDVIEIAAGYRHTLALKSDGTVWTWGFGIGFCPSIVTVPIQVSNLTDVVEIATGHFHDLALKSDGTVQAWGYNQFGQLGNGTTSNSCIPVQVLNLTDMTGIGAGEMHSIALKTGGAVWAWGDIYDTFNAQLVSVQVSNLTDVVGIAATYHTLALKENGTIWAWGPNGNGQLGNGTTIASNVPVQVIEQE